MIIGNVTPETFAKAFVAGRVAQEDVPDNPCAGVSAMLNALLETICEDDDEASEWLSEILSRMTS
jgi:hypothetical protein